MSSGASRPRLGLKLLMSRQSSSFTSLGHLTKVRLLGTSISSRHWPHRRLDRVLTYPANYFHRNHGVQLPDRRTDFIVRSPYPDIRIPDDVSVSHLILNRLPKYGNMTALIDGVTGKEMTYSELHTSMVKVASALVKLGLVKGDVVTIFSPNCFNFVIAALAVAAAGAIVSPVNPAYTSGELKHALTDVHARILFTVPNLLPVAKDAVQQCPHVKEIIVFDEAENYRPFSKLLEDDMTRFPENLDFHPKSDISSLPFSSGTTGLPKGVMLSHYNLVANVLQNREKTAMGYEAGVDCILAVLPFYHIYGYEVIMLAGLFCGAKIVIMPKFQPDTYLEAIQKYRSTILHVAPPLILFLAKHPSVLNYDLSSMMTIFTGAGPAPVSAIIEVVDRIKGQVSLRQGYGLTETSPMTNCNSRENNKYHTVGPVANNTQFKIVDLETGEPLGTGKKGEVCIRGPQVMMGYFENKQATDETIVDGWLRTGDVGHCDEDNHLIIDDRIKELIKVKGLQVAPAELEAILVTHPSVQDAAVIGKKHEKLGEAPKAFVVLKPDAKVSVEELMQYIDERVAPHKRLVGGIEFRSQIPKSASGKILRRILKAETNPD